MFILMICFCFEVSYYVYLISGIAVDSRTAIMRKIPTFFPFLFSILY